jgi:hypothetical protein
MSLAPRSIVSLTQAFAEDDHPLADREHGPCEPAQAEGRPFGLQADLVHGVDQLLSSFFSRHFQLQAFHVALLSKVQNQFDYL